MRTQHGTPLNPDLARIEGGLFATAPPFAGETYEPEHDEKRLTGQLLAVFDYLQAHEWVTLRELADATGGSEAGVSARLRDLRKPEFGHHPIERRRVDGGLYQYRLTKGPTR